MGMELELLPDGSYEVVLRTEGLDPIILRGPGRERYAPSTDVADTPTEVRVAAVRGSRSCSLCGKGSQHEVTGIDGIKWYSCKQDLPLVRAAAEGNSEVSTAGRAD